MNKTEKVIRVCLLLVYSGVLVVVGHMIPMNLPLVTVGQWTLMSPDASASSQSVQTESASSVAVSQPIFSSRTLLDRLEGQDLYFPGPWGANAHLYSHGNSVSIKYNKDNFYDDDDIASASCTSSTDSFSCTMQPVNRHGLDHLSVLTVKGKSTQDYTEIKILDDFGVSYYNKVFNNIHN